MRSHPEPLPPDLSPRQIVIIAVAAFVYQVLVLTSVTVLVFDGLPQ